jgi:hypothetical protein
MPNSIEGITCHLDYLTLTIPEGAEDGARVAWATCCETAMCAGGRMADRHVARILGYLGVRSGQVFTGARRDSKIMQASGDLAARAFALEWPIAARCTRVDLAIDVSYSEYIPWIAEVTADEALTARETGKTSPETKITLYSGFGRGDTAYVGSRQSDKCLRVYDKWKESDDSQYRNTWRWELELKGRAARGAYRGLRESRAVAGAISGTIENFLGAKGIDCGPRVGTFGGVLGVEPRGKTSDNRRLEWLAHGVAPTVERLICVFGRNAVELALGLRASVRE